MFQLGGALSQRISGPAASRQCVEGRTKARLGWDTGGTLWRWLGLHARPHLEA
jgi:hypothetical protein